MKASRPIVNIVNAYGNALFTPHFDSARDGYDVVENGSTNHDWDLLIVFEAMAAPASYRVRSGGAVFVSGEPPEIGGHARAFLRQFDAVFCAGAPDDVAPTVSSEQHFNNWHFGFDRDRGTYRYTHAHIRDLPAPEKMAEISTVTSNLNYLPMHIRRRALIDRLAQDYAGRIDIFGRPHRFVRYKEDAILPYRFHLCVENCSVPGLWTEKIADALLSYAVPIYAGCPDIERYFPGATIPLDLYDYDSARCTIARILDDGEAIYRDRLDAVASARRRLIADFDISALIRARLSNARDREMHEVLLRPEATFPFARSRELLRRGRRRIRAAIDRRRVAYAD